MDYKHLDPRRLLIPKRKSPKSDLIYIPPGVQANSWVSGRILWERANDNLASHNRNKK